MADEQGPKWFCCIIEFDGKTGIFIFWTIFNLMFVLFSRDQSFYILFVGCVGAFTTCGLNILFARPGNFMLHPDKVDLPDNLIF